VKLSNFLTPGRGTTHCYVHEATAARPGHNRCRPVVGLRPPRSVTNVTIALILIGTAAVIGSAIAPFVLPWPQRVRWLLASTAMPDPTGMNARPPTMREVTVGRVHRSGEHIAVELIEAKRDTPTWYSIQADAATLESAADLDHWSAAQTPLLLIAGTDRDVSLHGPANAVTGLQSVPLKHSLPRRTRRPELPQSGSTAAHRVVTAATRPRLAEYR